MSPTGSSKPLFDLIPKARQPEEVRVAHTDTADRDDSADHRAASRGRLDVPVTGLYLAAAGAILLLVIAYGVGYRIGAAAERAEITQLAARDADRVFADPLANRSEPNESAIQTTPVPPSPSVNRPGGSDGEILTATGVSSVDPRIVGSNYLELATLPEEQARQAVRYLASVGMEAIAVPASGVDRRAGGPNTSDRHRVIALGLAVPGDRYSSSAAERERFERRIARIGKAWAEQGGASDFSDPLWRRFGG